MAWVAVDENGYEYIYEDEPTRDNGVWVVQSNNYIQLPIFTIKKLIGNMLTWDDDPVELK